MDYFIELSRNNQVIRFLMGGEIVYGFPILWNYNNCLLLQGLILHADDKSDFEKWFKEANKNPTLSQYFSFRMDELEFYAPIGSYSENLRKTIQSSLRSNKKGFITNTIKIINHHCEEIMKVIDQAERPIELSILSKLNARNRIKSILDCFPKLQNRLSFAEIVKYRI